MIYKSSELHNVAELFESEKKHAYRAVVRETVATLDYPRLVHVDGRDLLHDVQGLCADLVHVSLAST